MQPELCRHVNISTIITCYIVAFTLAQAEVIITDKDGKKLPEVIGPMNEGSHLSLVCETDGDSPSVVTWWKGSYLLDDSFTTMPHGAVRNELMVSSLHRSDYMTAFTCQASLPNITRPSETSVSIDLNLRPLDVHITSLQRPLSANREVKLVCQSRGSRPSAIITWWLGSKQLMDAKNTSTHDISASTLYFVPMMEYDRKVLSCRASNPILDGGILEDHWVLNIYYVPQLVVTFGTPKPHIKEGDDVYFDCNIQANPAVVQVGWKFNGKTMYTKLTAGIKVNNQSLLLRKVTKKNSGHYSCVAANVEGEGASPSVHLNVHYIPYCRPNQKLFYGTPIHESVEVKCSVEANPEKVVFEWYMNTSITQIPIKRFVTNGTESTVLFTPKRKTDYGHLFCRAWNTAGMQKESCCYKISPASVPYNVENCVIVNETVSSVSISCDPGFDGGLPQLFHFELYSMKGLHAEIKSVETPDFEVSGLPSGISFIAVIFSTNQLGRSNSLSITVKTHRHTEAIKSVVISPILCALIVVIGSLVLIAIIIVVGIRHQDASSNEGQVETLRNPVYPFEFGASVGELKPGQYI